MPSGCFICKDLFDVATDIVATKCGHLFHNMCIYRWLALSYNCPECHNTVPKESLNKLFFHNMSDINSEKSLDILKEKLHEKDLEIENKDKKITHLQIQCAQTQGDIENLLEVQMELQNEVSAIEEEVQNLGPLNAENQMLLESNNSLQFELENMKHVKKIVEGCSNDAKKILNDRQVHAYSEEGKVATQRIATYCSLIKQQVVLSKEEKAQLQNEITQLKHQIGIILADQEKKQQTKQHFSNMAMNSPSQCPSSVPSPTFGVSDKCSSQNRNHVGSTLAYCPSGESRVTPKRKGQKIGKFDSISTKSSIQITEPRVVRQNNSALHARRVLVNKDVVSDVRYGLRDRAQIVKPSCICQECKNN